MQDSFVLSLFVATVGTFVLLVLRLLLRGMLDHGEYLIACFVAAFVSTYALAPVRLGAWAWRVVATFVICVVTYLAIAASHLVARRATWDDTVTAEAASLLFWAIFTTAWWVYPCALVTLAAGSWWRAGSAVSCRHGGPPKDGGEHRDR